MYKEKFTTTRGGAIMVNYRNLAYFGKYPFNDNVVFSKPNQAQGNKQEFGITKWFSKVLRFFLSKIHTPTSFFCT